MKRYLSILGATAILCTASAAQSRPRKIVEQSTFNLGTDDPVVEHPVQLSDAELAALANDEMMKKELDQDPPISKLTREGLEAAVVHLHSPSERDLVVVGAGHPFLGANVGPFWVIRDLPSGPEVVLSVITLTLSIEKTSFNGVRNIEANAATGVDWISTDFRFDGKKYHVHKESSGPIGK